MGLNAGSSPAYNEFAYTNTFAYILTACKARAYKNIECVSIWYSLMIERRAHRLRRLPVYVGSTPTTI